MDSVSISEEAREMLAAMIATQPEEENVQSENDAGAGAAFADSAGGASPGDSTSKLQSLKAKLGALLSALGQASSLDAANINAQISQIMSEVAALEAEGA
jgi:hypothetical protein